MSRDPSAHYTYADAVRLSPVARSYGFDVIIEGRHKRSSMFVCGVIGKQFKLHLYADEILCLNSFARRLLESLNDR